MKMQETKTWLEIQWKSLKAHSPAISATTIAEMAFQAQRSLNFFFSVIAAIVTTIGNQAFVNLNVDLIRIKPVWSLSSSNVSLLFFFYMHILAFQELSVRVCKPWNPVYPWFNAVVKINLLNLLKWTKLLDPSNFYLVWCLFISMARWCWG